jgi:hypothetical protein
MNFPTQSLFNRDDRAIQNSPASYADHGLCKALGLGKRSPFRIILSFHFKFRRANRWKSEFIPIESAQF